MERTLQVTRYADAGAFLDAAQPWLAAAEVENNVMLTIGASLADGKRALKEPPYFATAHIGHQIDCCAMRTPPHNILVTAGSAPGIDALAADAFEAQGCLPGVNGPAPAAARFADSWLKLAGGQARINMRQRLHRIERINPDIAPTRGALRLVHPSERGVAVQWANDFVREALPDQPNEAEDNVDRHLKAGTMYFWDDGRPVAICASAGGTPGCARINFVYTPPEHRRQGYATAAVSELTKRLFDSGRRYCCLYTDLANPTSNSVYRRIGYRGVCDVDQYLFSAS